MIWFSELRIVYVGGLCFHSFQVGRIIIPLLVELSQVKWLWRSMSQSQTACNRRDYDWAKGWCAKRKNQLELDQKVETLQSNLIEVTLLKAINLPECLMPEWPFNRWIERWRDIFIGLSKRVQTIWITQIGSRWLKNSRSCSLKMIFAKIAEKLFSFQTFSSVLFSKSCSKLMLVCWTFSGLNSPANSMENIVLFTRSLAGEKKRKTCGRLHSTATFCWVHRRCLPSIACNFKTDSLIQQRWTIVLKVEEAVVYLKMKTHSCVWKLPQVESNLRQVRSVHLPLLCVSRNRSPPLSVELSHKPKPLK